MGFGFGEYAEPAVLSLQEQNMSDSEDSNFSEEEDSERSSDGEEAEVCGRDAGAGVAAGAGRGQLGGHGELWFMGAVRLSGEREVGKPTPGGGTGAEGQGCARRSATTGGVKGPGLK